MYSIIVLSTLLFHLKQILTVCNYVLESVSVLNCSTVNKQKLFNQKLEHPLKPSNPIKTAISTLRPGDVITDLACPECAHQHIVVLERDPGGTTFELSKHSNELLFLRDERGPYQWKGSHKMFFDRHGRPHDHIGPESRVVESLGSEAVRHYKSIPALPDVRYAISPLNLAGVTIDNVTKQKMEVLFGRVRSAQTAQEQVDYMQLVAQLLFGNVQLNEEQMRGVLVVMNRFAVMHLSSRRSPLGGLEDILGMMFGDLVDVQIVDLHAGYSRRRDGGRGANHSHDAGHMDHARG